MLRRLFLALLLVVIIFCSACTSPTEIPQPTLPAQVVPTPVLKAVWFPPYLPAGLVSQVFLPSAFIRVDDPQQAELRLDVGSDSPLADWVYALVAPFPTVTDEVSLLDLQQFWSGQLQGKFPAKRLIMDGSTLLLFSKLWGNPQAEKVNSLPSAELLDTAWEEKTTWAIIPFEELQPRWKVIALDGQSPIEKKFNPQKYGLSVPFSFIGNAEAVQFLFALDARQNGSLKQPFSNRDINKLTVVAMTGVTALVRGTAYFMERYGMTYPALDIGSILREADITHISNEVPFWPKCPKPFSDPEKDRNMVFCSRPEYIQLLEAVGTDVVELTGDHFRDWGPDPTLYTLELYDQRGWQYYGGGRNLQDGMKPALFEHNGNKIAFLGCNAKLAGYASASTVNPGAVLCDLEEMSAKIKEVINQGYQPIFTFQHIEYYRYDAVPKLQSDFQKVAQSGAVIVSGSQAHQPHAMQFFRGSFLHFGLGNLFFDQYGEGIAQRKAFIDLHVFYHGKHISTQLITIMFTDMARSRLMTASEREILLKDVFFASRW